MTDDQSTILLSAAETTLTTSFKAQSTAVTVRAEQGPRVTARGSSQLANVFKVTPRVRRPLLLRDSSVHLFNGLQH